jgi:hypothetical protein
MIVIPPALNLCVGIPLLALGVLAGLWTLWGFLHFKNFAKLITEKVSVGFKEANFDAIGMSTPYIDFYFNVHSCLSDSITLTGDIKGELWNPCVEAWKAQWETSATDQSVIKPKQDTKIKIRWFVPQGHHNSPMVELAFRAVDKPPEQMLTFEDMLLGVKAKFLGIGSNVVWMQLPGRTTVAVPNHFIFKNIRQGYLNSRTEEDRRFEKLITEQLDSQS